MIIFFGTDYTDYIEVDVSNQFQKIGIFLAHESGRTYRNSSRFSISSLRYCWSRFNTLDMVSL